MFAGVAAIAAVVLAATPSHALDIKKMTLSNGATLLVSEEHQLPMVTMMIEFDAGTRRDPKGKEGIGRVDGAMPFARHQGSHRAGVRSESRFHGQLGRRVGRARLFDRLDDDAEKVPGRDARFAGGHPDTARTARRRYRAQTRRAGRGNQIGGRAAGLHRRCGVREGPVRRLTIRASRRGLVRLGRQADE